MPYSLEEVKASLDENMPSMSPTASKVMELAKNINCPPAELTRAIKMDPVLTAKVMRLINSSYFSLSQKIVSLEKAIILLGLNTVKNLALSTAVLAQTRENGDGGRDDFWKHSLAVGASAKMIAQARQVKSNQVEDYFLAGLMHNLGLLVESRMFKQEMRKIAFGARAKGLLATERAELGGLDHLQIGSLLAEHWGLSPDLCAVMGSYYAPALDGPHAPLVLSVHVASVLCKNNDVGTVMDRTPLAPVDGAWDALGLEPSVGETVMSNLDEELAKAMEFLQ